MIKILLIEDNLEKRVSLRTFITNFYGEDSVFFIECTCFAQARKQIFENSFDLILTDLVMPRRIGDPELANVSSDLIELFSESRLNSRTMTVAITQFPDVLTDDRPRFSEVGIILIHYDIEKENWKAVLNACLQRLDVGMKFDFLIFCALEKEREAFRNSDCTVGELFTYFGIDLLKIQIGDLNGACIKLGRMGLVESSVVASRSIQTFRPELVAMSGICAGFRDESNIGNIIVADTCWEHQAGKWKGDEFKTEHYHSSLNAVLRSDLSQFIESSNPFTSLKKNLISNAIVTAQPVVLKPLVSGSAVIASQERVDDIIEQHRKVAGLDMELFGVFRASELAEKVPYFFGAKTVVDLADEAKGDEFHIYGSVISARFVVEALKMLGAKIRP